MTFDKESSLVQRSSDLVREVFSTEIALNSPEIETNIVAEQFISSDTAGNLGEGKDGDTRLSDSELP